MADLDGALEASHPDNFRKYPMMIACAAVIVRDGKLLLACGPYGFWSGVGGWVEEGERPEDAILREIREELGVEAEVTEVLHPFLEWRAFNASDGSGFLLFLYRVRLLSWDFTLQESEVKEVRWTAPDDWADLPMMPYVRETLEERADEWLATG